MKKADNDGKQQQQKSMRSGATSKIYGLLRIVSSGASTVARSAVNAVAQSIADRSDGNGADSGHDQVLWAGFDKMDVENTTVKKVLLLGYRSGFQVWDVEQAENVYPLVSKHDGPASFLQMLPNPSKNSTDKFFENRPIMVLCSDGSYESSFHELSDVPSDKNTDNYLNTGTSMPTAVRFYSLASHSYVHTLKFRSVIHSIRCSSRVVAICQGSQIHCLDASTLEKDYTILTNPVISGIPGGGGGYGPLAVGSRWLAYSGGPVQVSNPGRVIPQHLTPSTNVSGFSSNTNLVAHYAKESSKHLAAGIVTLGDLGYKKLSRYCSELILDSHAAPNVGWKSNGSNGQIHDVDNVGMVVVRDIVSKGVVSQFRAHRSSISALCFDPSGTLLVTASVQGHSMNVFRIIPASSSSGNMNSSYAHLYKLQRGVTNAIIQDICFSDDSLWIMVSTSRGTSHLFTISCQGGCGSTLCDSKCSNKPIESAESSAPHDTPVSSRPRTLSAVSRIRNGSSFSGVIASSFRHLDGMVLSSLYHLLVFSPLGSLIQYSLRIHSGIDSAVNISGVSTPFGSDSESDGRVVIEPIQKWNIFQKKTRGFREDNIDIYGDRGATDCVHKEKGKMNGFHGREVEKKHNLYISEAELHMYSTCKPIFARAEIFFHPVVANGVREYSSGGEYEIEQIPTRSIEARSKGLIPVVDYNQPSKLQITSYQKQDAQMNGILRNLKPYAPHEESILATKLAEDGSVHEEHAHKNLYEMDQPEYDIGERIG